MQIRTSALVIFLNCLAGLSYAQTSFLPLGSKEQWWLDRLEIKLQRNRTLTLNTVKPYDRALIAAAVDSTFSSLEKGQNPYQLSDRDRYNLQQFLIAGSDVTPEKSAALLAVAKAQKKTPDFLYNGQLLKSAGKQGFVIINPAVAIQQGREQDESGSHNTYFRALGVTGRGGIGRKLGFQFMLTQNQEHGPLPFRTFVANNDAVPGAGKFTAKGNGGYQYLDVRGSANVRLTPYIDAQLGYDQPFIGTGYRSLWLSNFSGNSLFLRLSTRIWKVNYTNMFMQLGPTPDEQLNAPLPKKYMVLHHLAVHATPWLTFGAFESIVFGRRNGYDLSYLQPVIFLRTIEQQNGSPDNANLGFDVKANIAGKLQLHGQLMIDELVKNEAIGKGRRYWWGNKQAFQLGARYVDVLGIRNLDLQAELNNVRPFTYQFRDTAGAYANRFQPLAHPLGGNFREITGILKYQPVNRLYLQLRVISWKQGLDSAGFNFGANPNDSYMPVGSGGRRLRATNYPMFSGMPATGLNATMHLSYELFENFFLDVTGMYRKYTETLKSPVNTKMVTVGIRWNMYRREYDY